MKEESKRKPEIEGRTEKRKLKVELIKRGMLGFIPPRILTLDKPTNFVSQKAINDKLYVVVLKLCAGRLCLLKSSPQSTGAATVPLLSFPSISDSKESYKAIKRL
jgi:hypothetical protein